MSIVWIKFASNLNKNRVNDYKNSIDKIEIEVNPSHSSLF